MVAIPAGGEVLPRRLGQERCSQHVDALAYSADSADGESGPDQVWREQGGRLTIGEQSMLSLPLPTPAALVLRGRASLPEQRVGYRFPGDSGGRPGGLPGIPERLAPSPWLYYRFDACAAAVGSQGNWMSAGEPSGARWAGWPSSGIRRRTGGCPGRLPAVRRAYPPTAEGTLLPCATLWLAVMDRLGRRGFRPHPVRGGRRFRVQQLIDSQSDTQSAVLLRSWRRLRRPAPTVRGRRRGSPAGAAVVAEFAGRQRHSGR